MNKFRIALLFFFVSFFIFSSDNKDKLISIIFEPNFKKNSYSKNNKFFFYVMNRLDLCYNNIKEGDIIQIPINEKFVFVYSEKKNGFHLLFLPNGDTICNIMPFPNDYNTIFEKYGYYEISEIKSYDIKNNTIILKLLKTSSYIKNLNKEIEIEFKSPPKKIIFSALVEDLRLRKMQGVNGEIIRLLEKGELLELIEEGNTDLIKGTKGKWIKIKSLKNNDEGWCFDAYLLKIEN